MSRALDVHTPAPSRSARRVYALALHALALHGCSVEARAFTGRSTSTVAPREPSAAPVAVSAPAVLSAPSAAAAPGPPAGDVPQPDPEASRVFLLRAAERRASATRRLAPPRVTALALANTARGEADGMQPEGAPLSLLLGEGDKATFPVRVEPGDCAVFIAQGGLGVIEVDLFLTSGAPPSLKILAQDLETGPIAVIGGRGACFRNRGGAATAAELHAQVRRGGGVVLVQGYRRARGAAPGAQAGSGT